MKALTIKHSEITRESLLMMTEDIRGAWIGIRVFIVAFWLDVYPCSRIIWFDSLVCV